MASKERNTGVVARAIEAFGVAPKGQTERVQTPLSVEVYSDLEASARLRSGAVLWDVITLLWPGGRYDFPMAPFFSISWEKRIEITELADGSDVIESQGNSPYNIEVKGLIIDTENHVNPWALAGDLEAVLRENRPFEIASPVLNDRGITDVVVTGSPSFEPVRGFPDTVSYSFSLRQVRSAEAVLLENDDVL